MKKILMVLGAMMLVSCSSETPMVSAASVPVDVVDATFAQNVVTLKNCTLKGQVLTSTMDRFEPTNLLVTEVELNEIKAKALYLGANTVVIRHNHIVYNKGMYVHVLNSEAYACYAPVEEHK